MPDIRLNDERAPAREARIQQDHEVADLVRDLVRHHGQRGDDTQVHVDEECAGDDDAVGEVVESVTDQDRHAAATRLVRVVPVRMMVRSPS